ncbi:MAG: hypothetical protein Q4F34_04660 [Prevotellaceae bacterium]|nr:hypothetical protein [Prevotellaceae bacterium]
MVYDGHIRNSLYGGGEMSAVGWGTVHQNTATNELELSSIEKAGSTFVEMYGGYVNADAFGGGRGYSYDNNGKMQYGTLFNTDGFVFGKTDINIYRGTIGTSETIKESNGSHGNVFGGGNVGYVYSGNGKKYESSVEGDDEDGNYYKVEDVNATPPVFVVANGNKSLTEDTRVNVQVYGQATAPVQIDFSVDFHPGFTIPSILIDRFRTYFNESHGSSKVHFFYINEDGTSQGDEITTLADADALLDADGRANTHFRYVDEGGFEIGDYIPNDALNVLTNTDTRWEKINQDGITIRNAVFAGGNVSKGSDKVYAFANTVFGNSTAAIIDVYCRDLIDVGGDGIGGIYGDGNLTFVDGYRELNVTNYGTDYYALSGNIDFTKTEDVERYNQLTDRQKDFYTTEYTCKQGIGSYSVGDVITNDDLVKLANARKDDTSLSEEERARWDVESAGWSTTGVWTTYFDRSAAIINEGRYLNTIQRADYCGLKGSRLVMKGAMDRALDEGEDIDYTPYTINRVGELSLNQNNKTLDGVFMRHGSYAGFYNVVKYLSSMSSDKNFVTGLSGSGAGTADIAQSSIRETNSENSDDTKDIQVNFKYTNGGTGTSTVEPITPVTKHLYDPETPTTADNAYTFFEWKVANHDRNNRNNGTSPNKIALASGVYLELVDGLNSAGEKNYGPIIGVVELDLLNVAPGEGGGFVYAKNHHGMPHFDTNKSYASVLSDANYHLKTVRAYFYDDDENAPALFNGVETSGNFVHSSKRIVDDCFPTSNSYMGAAGASEPYAPAHYWFLRGDFYVYEQLVSAYTGQAATYNSNLNLPLDINGKQNATLRLVNVLPGLYTAPEAAAFIDEERSDSLEIIFDNVTKTFGHNDPVSYWDWRNMNNTDQGKFVLTTYTCTDSLTVDYGDDRGEVTYAPGQAILPAEYAELASYEVVNDLGETVKAQTFFGETNGVNNKNGFLLTLDLTNPDDWNDYYTKQTKVDDVLTTQKYTTAYIENAIKTMTDEQKAAFLADYVKSATFTCNQSGVYGQYSFVTGDVISETIYGMEAAVELNLNEEQKAALRATLAKFENAYITVDSCDITIGSEVKTVLKGYPMSATEFGKISAASGQTADGTPITEINKLIEPAYICVSTIEVADKDFRYLNQLVSKTEYDSKYKDKSYNGKTLGDKFQPAHYCIGGEATGSNGGSWGGKYYEEGKVYQGEDVCNVIVDTKNTDKDERKHFTFNYDALDLLVANYIPYYIGTGGLADEAAVIAALRNAGTALNGDVKYYDSATPDAEGAQTLYRSIHRLDVDATFLATTDGNKIFSYIDESVADNHIDMTTAGGQVLKGEQFDNLPNDRKNYVPFNFASGYVVSKQFTASNGKAYNVGDILNPTEYSALTHDEQSKAPTETKYAYIVKEGFDVGGKRYNAGQTLAPSEYRDLVDANKGYVDLITGVESSTAPDVTYYYCIQEYKIGEKDGYVTNLGSIGTTANFTSPNVTTIAHDSKLGSTETTIESTEVTNGNNVPLGSIIAATTMGTVPNYQMNFSLSGTSPVEEATLYVPASASITDLLKDRYVTAIYEYRYSETNDGINYETFVEKHIINILVKFLDGQPKIGPLTPPDLILPTENIAMAVPAVEEGAFPIVGAGWEIFPTLAEAQKHINGAKYDNGRQPLYWYQNGYYICYYAETSRGRTYSQPEEIKVANYHKLSDVVNDANHLFIDHKDCDRNPKIYIDDKMINIKANTEVEAKSNVNELDALKSLFELSTTSYGQAGGKINGTGDDAGKILLQNHGRDFSNCSNLEFIIRDNIDQKDYTYTVTGTDSDGNETSETTTEARPWTAIGTSTNCFSGNVHGNGHTISGLEQSLFDYFCGHVYNLGATGPFTGAGIANHGDGRAENCWVGSALQTPMGCKAVMGDDGAAENPAYIINCYYPDVNDFVSGTAKVRTASDFLNGQVAYDLNRFYLDARYLKHSSTKIENGGLTQENAALNRTSFDVMDKIENLEYTGDVDENLIPTMYPLDYAGTLSGVLENTSTDPETPNKENRGADCLLYPGYYKWSYNTTDGVATRDKVLGYVEHMYEDGDFRYADGLKPKQDDMRKVDDNVWLPIFPDDYIFFGQKLSYTLYESEHGQHPTAAVKEKTTVESSIVNNDHNGLLTSNAATTNRIYRAPAYFRNGVYGNSAIFNKTAAFADEVTVAEAHTITGGEMGYSDGEIPFMNLAPKGNYYPHHNMTAIDFTGYNDNNWTRGNWTTGTIYEPLLDYYGLEDIKVKGLTQNLLVYIPDNDTKSGGGIDNDGYNTQTATMVNTYFADAAITETNTTYRTVAASDPTLRGHVVQKKTGDGYVAHTDHRLIDKQDFNAPISYKFDNGKRMWYQRKPEHGYANKNMGWDAVCLPFEVELVTTQDKGEITHFYTPAGDDYNSYKGKTTGHEYWLREFMGKGEKPKEEETDPTVYIANFAAIQTNEENNSHVKDYTNTFLYDYYYSKDAFQDKNLDKYQEQYYKTSQTYNGYPFGQAGAPYIAGFPGNTYYEFDLSGNWTPQHRIGDVTIASKGAQTITFASAKGAEIAFSDGEITGKSVEADGYTFKSTYLMAENTSIADNSYYEMNANGGSFDLVDSTEVAPRTFNTVAFRPYFVKAKASGAKEEMTRSIVFGEGNDKMNDKESEDNINRRLNGMKIYVSNNKLVVESTYEADLNVNYISGAFARRIHVNQGTNVYEGLRPGFYLAGRTKVYIRPTAY